MKNADKAICNEKKAAKKAAFRPLVYICSRFAGNVAVNTERAKEYCRFALSNEVWVFSDGEISAGMKAEISTARMWHQTIRRFNENCEEVSS